MAAVLHGGVHRVRAPDPHPRHCPPLRHPARPQAGDQAHHPEQAAPVRPGNTLQNGKRKWRVNLPSWWTSSPPSFQFVESAPINARCGVAATPGRRTWCYLVDLVTLLTLWQQRRAGGPDVTLLTLRPC
eukprot:1183864-Prorocentrum_minimum.AAC.1